MGVGAMTDQANPYPKYKAIKSFLADGNYWFQGQTVPAEVADMNPDKVELVK